MIGWALLITSVVLIWYFTARLPDNYPPTPPIKLPIIGHAHYLFLYKLTKSTMIYEVFRRYSKEGVLTLHIGTWRFTIIGTQHLVKSLFSREDTNYRVPAFLPLLKKVRQNFTGTEGVLFNQGRPWQEQRKFLLATLKNFGVGKTEIEVVINHEVAHFCKYAEEVLVYQMGSIDEKERPLNIFHIPIINILWEIVAGKRYDYKDPKLAEFAEKITALTRVPLFQPNAATFFPFLAKFFPKIDEPPCYDALVELKAFLNDTITQHRDSFDPNNIRDFIDTYLLEIQEKGVEGSSFHASQGYEQLVNMLEDLFIAGMDTSSNTLSFAILFMVNNQEVQLKVREEIFDVVGRETQPSLADKPNMPYCEATVMEIQRMADVVPDGVIHVTTSPLNAGPFIIPAGHTIMPSLTAVLNSDQDWVEPDKFNPSRFIEDGRVKKSENFIPFSAGKRQCPGESLAKAELFLFFVGIIQKFHFESMHPGKKIEIVAQPGLTMTPLPTNPIKVTKII